MPFRAFTWNANSASEGNRPKTLKYMWLTKRRSRLAELPSCPTGIESPPTEMWLVRFALRKLGNTVYPITCVPVPVEGYTCTHLSEGTTTHGHPEVALTVNEPVLPVAVASIRTGVTEMAHAAVCVMDTDVPATSIVPERVEAVLLAGTVIVTLPEPERPPG
jgi:hypothetical protein